MLARYKTMLSGVVNVGPLQDKVCQEWSMLARYKTRLVRSGQCWPVTRQCLSGVVNVDPLQDNVCQEWSMLARYKTMLLRSGQC
jgi:hypothetical protein